MPSSFGYARSLALDIFGINESMPRPQAMRENAHASGVPFESGPLTTESRDGLKPLPFTEATWHSPIVACAAPGRWIQPSRRRF
jgi:hypothetical protein